MSRDVHQSQTINQRKRQFYEESSLVLGRLCLKLGLTPNFLTALSLICALIAGIFFWRAELWWGVFFILATAFTDMLDGSTARAGNMGAGFGGLARPLHSPHG